MNDLLRVSLIALAMFSPLSAQGSNESAPCPNRGIKPEPAHTVGTDGGQPCSFGLSFVFQNVLISASEEKCPLALQIIPLRDIPDNDKEVDDTEAYVYGQVATKLQLYSCNGGCGFLFLFSCCETNGLLQDGSSVANYAQRTCGSGGDE